MWSAWSEAGHVRYAGGICVSSRCLSLWLKVPGVQESLVQVWCVHHHLLHSFTFIDWEPLCTWLRQWGIRLQLRRPEFNPWVRKVPWRRAWQPTPFFLPGESPWTEEPGGLWSMVSQSIGHCWATNTHFLYSVPRGCWKWVRRLRHHGAFPAAQVPGLLPQPPASRAQPLLSCC